MARKLSAAPKRRQKQRRMPAGIPVEQTNLTAEERAMLPDPRVLTEDDADAITAYRNRNEKRYSFDSVLKRYGLTRRVDR
jgi:hypothetical protein